MSDNDQTNPAEVKAKGNGWVPLEEWHGDEGDWVDYKEFNLRGELMGRINEQSSIINHLKNKVTERDAALTDIKKLQETISEREYKKALRDLQAKKVEAMREEDYEGVVNLDEEIEELKTKRPTEDQKDNRDNFEGNNEVPPEITAWLSDPKNAWYHQDSTLRAIADGIATGIQTENPNISPSRLIAQVEEQLQKEMPHRFKGKSVPDVDSGGDYVKSPRERGKSVTFRDLSEEQQAVCRRFEKIGLMTKEEYIKSLQDAGEL